jgi:hypothetical protein
MSYNDPLETEQNWPSSTVPDLVFGGGGAWFKSWPQHRLS